MGSVFMAFDAGFCVKLRITITTQMIALVNKENFFTAIMYEAFGHSETKKSSADDKDVWLGCGYVIHS